MRPEIHGLIGWMKHTENTLTEGAVWLAVTVQNEHLLELLRHFIDMVVPCRLGYPVIHGMKILANNQWVQGLQDERCTLVRAGK